MTDGFAMDRVLVLCTLGMLIVCKSSLPTHDRSIRVFWFNFRRPHGDLWTNECSEAANLGITGLAGANGETLF